jgi:serine/threonine protein kinase
MARVYRGLDENLNRPAAVKVLEINIENEDERIIERFKLEARAIASFEHPNIVSIYQFGESENLFFIAMKLVKGSTLSQLLRQMRRSDERIPLAKMMQIVRDVCDALDYAHARGIIHRDIKPSNILFDSTANDRAIITDFGLALELGGDSTLGTAFGTPRYIAPEQAVSSLKAVPQSDIYALSVVVYEMLTGQVPFQDESPMSIALYHITSEPPRPRTINPDIPEAVEDVILRALSKEPEDRYPTAGAFYDALEEAYQQSEIELSTLSVKPTEMEKQLKNAQAKQRQAAAAVSDTPVDEPPAKAAEPAKAESKKPQKQKKEKPARQRKRRRVGCIPALVMLLIVVGGIMGFWLLNGQSLILPSAVTDALNGLVETVSDAILPPEPDLTGTSVKDDAIPTDVELAFELVYDDTYFVLHNLIEYHVPIDTLTLEWVDGSRVVTYTGEDFRSPIPPGQCAWIRMLAEGTMLPPEGCDSPSHTLRMLTSEADIFWTGTDEFRILVDGREVRTCLLNAGRCAFTLPRE